MIEDDWMNPPRSMSWTYQPHPDGTFYLISRKKRIPVSGNVSHIERWDTWKEFSDKDARDAELKRLRETTSWVLRSDQVTYLNDAIISGPNSRDEIDL